MKTIDDQYRAAAKKAYHNQGEDAIDDNAVVVYTEEGAYVQAWVWVDKWQVRPTLPKKS